MAVPLGLAALFFASGGLGLVISVSAGIRRTPSPVHLLCMILMALFLCLVGWSFVRVATKGFIKEVVLTERGLVVHWVHRSEEFKWAEINRFAATQTGLNLRVASGAEIDLGPSLEDFEQLVTSAKEQYNKAKGIRPIPPVS